MNFKTAILCYNYNKIINKNSNYCPCSVNLGDYIQSLAAKQFLPNFIDPILVDRDTLKNYNGQKVKLIMNCWYFLNENNEELSPKIDPLFVSFHINNPQDLTLNTINYLKRHEPIGCRDLATLDVLSRKGIQSYFSGCLTTTLDKKYKVNDNERSNEIYFCDYKFGTFTKADEYIKSLKNYNFNSIKFTTHDFTKQSTHKERFKVAEDLIRKYSKAKLVVTSRLHCALPCLALGTPVIFVTKRYDTGRFDGLCDLLNVIVKYKDGNFKIKVDLDDNGNVINSKSYLPFANNLKYVVEGMLKETI